MIQIIVALATEKMAERLFDMWRDHVPLPGDIIIHDDEQYRVIGRRWSSSDNQVEIFILPLTSPESEENHDPDTNIDADTND